MIPVLFEDEDILAVNKPEGLASIPKRTAGEECLLSMLSSSSGKLYVVHRLDKEVSGLILFAKNADAHRDLSRQFSAHNVCKTYIAITQGWIPDEGVIAKSIRQFGSGRMGVDEFRGKPCVTKFRVAQRVGACSLVEVWPITGRRHQIRVHFYSIGHPIAGDLRYGDRAKQREFPRLMLHAYKIECQLSSGKKLCLKAPLPECFNLLAGTLSG